MSAPRMRDLTAEVVSMALRSLSANRMRSLLTTLGVVIGVGTVVAMTSIIQGFDRTVQTSISSFGSHVIYLRKVKPGVFNPDLVDSVRRTPAFTADDAEALRRLCPDVRQVSIVGFVESVTLGYRGRSSRGVQVIGADPAIQEVNAYDPWVGRFFTEEEVRRRAQVAVVGKAIRDDLMGGVDPIGRTLHINGVPFRIVGELEPKGRSLFFNPDEILTIPYTTMTKLFPPGPDASFFVPARGEYYLNAVAVSPDRSAAAVDQIVEVLRQRRGKTHRQPNDFAVFTEEALAELYNQITGATYVVMLLISSIALLVGGIGVMNIMLVAVTERTREIGLRMAVGAPRRTVLLQFLLEAVCLTTVGGVIGLAAGAGVAQGVRLLTGLPAYTPLWVVLVAFGFSAAVGVFFGLYPAMRASRLDPVEALRWE